MDKSVGDRINLLRFIMIFGVVVLHTPEFVPVTSIGTDAFSLIKAYFQNAVFRTTVPVLTFISGYLLFQSGIDRFPKALAAKKFRSLVVPFMAFNLPLVALVWLVQRFFHLQTSVQLVPFDLAVWLDAVFGLLHTPVNYPLNFLRDMVVLMCLAPLMGLLIRRAAALGFVLVSLIFLNNLDQALILRGVMPILFYLGGVAAHKKWNMRALDRYALPCLAVFLLFCGAIIYFRIVNTTALRLVSPLLIWPACSLLLGTRVGNWCARMNKYSFFLFVAHGPMLFVTWLIFKHVGRSLPYPLYWAAAPVLTLAAIVALYHLGMFMLPNVFPILLGGRGKEQNKPVRQEMPASVPLPERTA
jgi:succinoglycan biosynthesis protein ExoH